MDRQTFKRQVQEATDIVRLIGEHVALKARGREFVALCPFHDDRSPSMYVSPAKQIYKCFACGAGGDAFSFVMDYHKMTFPEAVSHLADRAGMATPRTFDDGGRGGAGGGEQESPRQRALSANAQGLEYFRKRLADPEAGRAARDYLSRRGISDEMVRAFSIGYAPDGWDGLVTAAGAKRWEVDDLQLAGLVGRSDKSGKLYDRFRHRLIFPIFDMIGRPIAFGGRKLREEDEPKYLNSPESPVFNKSATLFGLQLARQALRETRTAIIVEGYTDVIACHQAGRSNVLATLGTALTRQHAGVLKRFCEEVVLVFDADEAGQNAAERALEVFFNEPLDVSIAVLPEGLDPADLLAKNRGLETWDESIRDAVDAMTFMFHRIKRQFDEARGTAARQRINEQFLRTLVQLGFNRLDPARKAPVISRLAAVLQIQDLVVKQMLDQMVSPRASAAGESAAQREERLTARHQAERMIVGCVLNHPSLFHAAMNDGRSFDEAVVPGDFVNAEVGRLFGLVYDRLCEADALDASALRDVVEDEALLRLAASLSYETDRMVGGDARRYEGVLRGAVSALVRYRAEEAYRQQKSLASETRGEETSGTVDSDAERLSQAIAHLAAHPASGRTPRTAHL